MVLVAGIDSSTQSCKVAIRDAVTGRIVRHGSAPHPTGTEIDPEEWWDALRIAVDHAGGLDDVSALAVAGQQHGMVCLDVRGRVLHPALLWNDMRSAQAAVDLIFEAGDGDPAAGAAMWAKAVGTVPVASLTITKLRWLAEHEPGLAHRVAAVVLPHDWLTWRIAGGTSLDSLVTDRSDASGTGYFDSMSGEYRRDLLARALGNEDLANRVVLPRILGPAERAGRGDPAAGWGHLQLAPGCGDNAGAALGLALRSGQTTVSIGTSGVVASVSDVATHDPTGEVAGFADATGRYLPLACTLNASRVLDAMAGLLGVGHDELSELALSASPGADGLVLVPYLEGERTPNLPHASGTLRGMTLGSMSRANLARAAVEGMLCLLTGALDAVRREGAVVNEVILVGGGARSEAVRRIAPSLFGVPVQTRIGEYVAQGAARQAAWVLSESTDAPRWEEPAAPTYEADLASHVLERYREVAVAEAALVGPDGVE